MKGQSSITQQAEHLKVQWQLFLFTSGLAIYNLLLHCDAVVVSRGF